MEYYSIHNLLKIATNAEVPVPEYFKVKKPIRNPDLEVVEGPLSFKKPKENMLVRGNYFYWQDKGTLFVDYEMANAKVLVGDLHGKTKIKATKALRRFYTKENWRRFIHAVISFKLIKRGYAFVHAGALSYKGKEGVLIIAPPDTGKTSTILSLLSTGEFGFMSDDAPLLGNDFVYAYPQHVKISPYTLTGSMRLGSWKRRVLKSRRVGMLAEKILNLKIKDIYRVPEASIVDKNPLKKVFILGGFSKAREARKIKSKDAARALVLPSVWGSELMHPWIELYYHTFDVDTSDIFDGMKKITENSFKNVQCFKLTTPRLEGYAKTITEIMG